jgi:suppressor for copper-sensitivity B
MPVVMSRLLVLALLFAASAVVAPAGATAASDRAASPWATTAHGAVRLIAAVDAVGEGASVALGLSFRMNPGWHIYWRSPGDAGYPPQVNWANSANLAAADLSWPAPRRFSVLDLETIGYEDAVVLPIEARLRRPGEPLALRATVDYLTCADICVPYVAELALDLPAGEARPSAFAHEIARARALVPGRGHGLTVERVGLSGEEGDPKFVLALRSAEPLIAPDVFVEAQPPLAFGAPVVAMSGDRRTASLTVAVFNGEGLDRPLRGLPLTLTVIDGERSLEQPGTVSAPMGAIAAASPGASVVSQGMPRFAAIFGLALLGGLVLNLMPCVLPVLSMKLLALVGHGGGERRAVRTGFVAAAAGILFSFWLLAGAVVLLKATGHAVGWGLQFQQPWFLTAMVLVLALFACNLWGVVEIPLPRVFALAGERAGRARGLAGHFLTGALATLLATPCSAPFLGTAIGFALARGPAEIIAVFSAVAAGLALPYLGVAAFPSLATRLPKPGPWMTTLRRVLGLALAGTAAWLVWVLAGRIGSTGALAVGGLAASAVVGLAGQPWMPPRARPVGAAAAATLALAAFLVPANPPVDARPPAEDVWQPFEPERIAGFVAQGHTVFVNVTADWCLTCKVNERFVLARDPVRARLSERRVVAMRGDWTAPDDDIARYLAGFGRYGIPFDAVYGPALPRGEALPELLSAEAVTGALARAEGDGQRR